MASNSTFGSVCCHACYDQFKVGEASNRTSVRGKSAWRALVLAGLVALVTWGVRALLVMRVEHVLVARAVQALGTDVRVADVDVSLRGGMVRLANVDVGKPGGALWLTADEVLIQLPTWGRLLWRPVPSEVVMRGVQLELRGSRWPRTFDGHPQLPTLVGESIRVVVDSPWVPSLRDHAIQIHRVKTGPVQMTSPWSWVFALQTLEGEVELAFSARLAFAFHDGGLFVSGAVLGSDWMQLPFVVPVREPAREVEQLWQAAQHVLAWWPTTETWMQWRDVVYRTKSELQERIGRWWPISATDDANGINGSR